MDDATDKWGARVTRVELQRMDPPADITDLITIRYLEALAKIADGKATKIFLPVEATGVLKGLAAMGEMFKEGMEPLRAKPRRKGRPRAPAGKVMPLEWRGL